jgi:hypothetical protein
MDQIISWITGFELKGNSIKDSFSRFRVFHFLDGGHGIILDGHGSDKKEGNDN